MALVAIFEGGVFFDRPDVHEILESEKIHNNSLWA